MNLADMHNLQPVAPPGAPRRLRGRESLVVCYQSDAAAISRLLPAPLRPDGSNAVTLQFSATPATHGRGVDIVAQIAVDAELRGLPVQFIVRSWADELPEDSAELDFEFAPGRSRLFIVHDTMTGVLESAGRAIAIASMACKRPSLSSSLRGSAAAPIAAWLARPQVHVRRAFEFDGRAAATQLVERTYFDIEVSHASSGPAELDLAPLGASPLPMRNVLGGAHFIADLTLVASRVGDGRWHCAGTNALREFAQEARV